MDTPTKKQIGQILLAHRALTQAQLDHALASGGKGPAPNALPLASRLVEASLMKPVQALKGLSEQLGVPGIDLEQICLKLADLALVPREVALRHQLLPVLVREERVFLAMREPTNRKVIDEIEFTTGKRVFPYVALVCQLNRVISTAYEMKERGETYFVGPFCPPEVRLKAGIGPATPHPPRAGDTSQSGAFATSGIVDDAMEEATEGARLSVTEFGQATRELSVLAGPAMLRPPHQEGKRTVLVVDDEVEIRNILRIVLEQRGYRVLEADRGQSALRVLKDETPDVLILDAMLPGDLHGFDIAKQLKGSTKFANLPIIMVSAVYKGWRFAEDVQASYKVDAYIEKPFRVAEVIEAVERALEHGHHKRADLEKISAEAERKLSLGIEAYREGRFEEAIDHLREGTKLDPLAYRLHFHLGLLLGKRGHTYDAIGALETALRINGKHFPALKNLAVLYQKAGFRNKAVEVWERALRMAPDEPTRQSIKEILVGLL